MLGIKGVGSEGVCWGFEGGVSSPRGSGLLYIPFLFAYG